jgi:hypothetical protein
MRLLPSVVSLACVLLFARTGLADARAEAAAQGALKRVAVDYRGKHYAAAAARLEKAIRGCGDDKCLSDTRAALLRDLGTMQFRHGDAAAASKSFADALALESDLTLNPRYETPDLQAAWDDAKRSASAEGAKEAGGAAAAETPAAHPPEPAAAPSAGAEGSTEAAPETFTGPAPYARFWIGVAGAVDFLVFPSGNDLCKLTPTDVPANSVVAYCTNPDGSDFPARATSAQNDTLVPGRDGNTLGGLQVGDIRAMLAADYALSPSWLAGVRVGYVMNAYTGSAAVHDGRALGPHLHAEVRATYLLGRDPLASIGFAPMLFGGGGVSEFDGYLTGNVTVNNSVGAERVNIWVTDGPWFVTIGGGFRYQFSLRAAFTAAVRVNAAFFDNGLLPTAGPELGFQYGL